MRESRFAILILLTFTIGVLIGCWRTERLTERGHTCAICGEPLEIASAYGHQDCYQKATWRPMWEEMRPVRERIAAMRRAEKLAHATPVKTSSSDVAMP